MSLHMFEWPGDPPPMVDGEMAWFDDAGQWHLRHADGAVEDFPNLLAERLAEFRALVRGCQCGATGVHRSAERWARGPDSPAGHQGSENP